MSASANSELGAASPKRAKRMLDRASVFLRKHRTRVTAILGGALITAVVHSFSMNLLEAYLYDLRMRASPAKAQASLHSVLISIDDRTIERLNEYAPLSLKTHANLLNAIAQAKPKAISYFVDFSDAVVPQATDADQFVATAEALNASGTPVFLGTDVDVTGEVLPPYPLSKLPHRISLIHKDGTVFSEDKVTRRALFSVSEEPVLHVQLASLFTGKSSPRDYRGVYRMPEVEADYLLIRWAGRSQERRHPFIEISAIDVLDGKADLSTLNGKLVLIGTKSKENSGDFIYTPYSRSPYMNPKIVAHANIVETLILDNAVVGARRAVDIILTFLLTAFIISIVFRTTPENGVIATFVCSVALAAIAFAVFAFFGVWINLAHPLVGVSGAYYFFVPYRLIVEYKKRWEIQQKHEVLMQVEELKSNFMSLITHDLKTPVARIQGMAEILRRNGADSKVVSEIMGSTDELNSFITSILELAKIESNRVKVQRTSKDVNKLLEDSVRKAEFQAREKAIEIATELEPLFPIQLDTALIAKVLSNLIDNAIKYSPAGAAIKITSRESTDRAGFVEIAVSDTGHGIAEKDIKNLFSKFYRPKNDITLTTKGTGLGLYLSRYFVELHGGSIDVVSESGKGSTFTVFLPSEDPLDTDPVARATHSKGETYV